MIYQIWMEGFHLSGEEKAQASFVAEVEADSFQEACDKHYGENSLYNKFTLSFWGCGLFENEHMARKNFG